jgi:hypothetical protein
VHPGVGGGGGSENFAGLPQTVIQGGSGGELAGM